MIKILRGGKMKNKGKVIQTMHYEKGTILSNKEELINVINRIDTEIELKYQSVTDTKVQIMSITIIFKPENTEGVQDGKMEKS